MCGPALYAPQRAALDRADSVADVGRDDTVAAMAERLLAEAPERFVIAGLSMGGMVAMEVMVRAPERVAGALLMDTDPRSARPVEQAWRADEMADLRAQGPAGYIARFVAKFTAHDPGAAALLGPAMRVQMAQTPVAVIEAQGRALDGRRDLLAALEGFAAPVEVVVGSEDRVCPVRLHTALVEICADAVLTVIPDCGHIATLEKPDAVDARLAALLARVGDRR
jgi:pimeloyl-ACP methyl ester carboxylesterase